MTKWVAGTVWEDVSKYNFTSPKIMYFVYCEKTIIVIQTSLTIEYKRCVWEMDEEGGGGHYINTKNINEKPRGILTKEKIQA